MLTKLIIRNFKRFDDVEIELGDPVVFIGPNNSGKTTALQALALWADGLRTWVERRSLSDPGERPGVTINRRDLVSVPIPAANLLWRDLHTRSVQRIGGKQHTENIRMDIVVEGCTGGNTWECGLEFDYANAESFYCRPLRTADDESTGRMPVPEEAAKVLVAFLPPMSGLAAVEERIDRGAINVRISEGRTAEVLRNLCYLVAEKKDGLWEKIVRCIDTYFKATLLSPIYNPARGDIVLHYREKKTELDISSSGRGLQQILLLLSYMYLNRGAVILLDEPDAHLEILRQREIYQLLSDTARENGNQVVAASHSEVFLDEAAGRDVVVAFVGNKPHRIDDRGSQVSKSLRDIPFVDYYQAEETGWVLYLEGSTDLAILRAYAKTLDNHGAMHALERPFVKYVGNQPREAGKHFFGLKDAVPGIEGIGIFDRLEKVVPDDLCRGGMHCMMWQKREIENYLCFPATLEAFAGNLYSPESEPIFAVVEKARLVEVMKETIGKMEESLDTTGKGSPWDDGFKVSDEFLVPLFRNFFKKLNLPNTMSKTNFHVLAEYVPRDRIDPEVREKLDTIAKVFETARKRFPSDD